MLKLSHQPIILPIVGASYPEKSRVQRNTWETAIHKFKLQKFPPFAKNKILKFSKQIVSSSNPYITSDSTELQTIHHEICCQLLKYGVTEKTAYHSFCYLYAVLQQNHDILITEQHLSAAWLLLYGQLVEAPYLKNSHLAYLFTAITLAYAKIPVHIITLNDAATSIRYQQLSPLLEYFNLNLHYQLSNCWSSMNYSHDQQTILIGSYKSIGLNYLQDKQLLGQSQSELRLKIESLYKTTPRVKQLHFNGLVYALIDDADTMLIDQAHNPLSLSGKSEMKPEPILYRQAIQLANKLQAETDFQYQPRNRSIELTDSGKQTAQTLSQQWQGLWNNEAWRNEMLQQALLALHYFIKEQDYTVQSGKIIRQNQNQQFPKQEPDWDNGIQQMVEAKEKCRLTAATMTISRMTLQKFLCRYYKISGLVHTTSEIQTELVQIYETNYVKISPEWFNPSQCLRHREALHDVKIQNITTRTQEIVKQSQSVLIISHSINNTQIMVSNLKDQGIPFSIIQPAMTEEQLQSLHQFKQSYQVLLVLDISLLSIIHEWNIIPDHVLISEVLPTQRHTRKCLYFALRHNSNIEEFYSLEDNLLESSPRPINKLFCSKFSIHHFPGTHLFDHFLKKAQQHIQKELYQHHLMMTKHDQYIEQTMAFSGSSE